MNARARRLGMNGSHFGTPNGWPDRGATHVTARDLVRLAQALIVEHPAALPPLFRPSGDAWRGQRLASHDPFAGVVPGADGIKTGHTFEAGFNFLGAAERQGRRLVVVVAGAHGPSRRAPVPRAPLPNGALPNGTAGRSSAPGRSSAEARVQDGDARRVPLAVPRRFAISVPKGSHPQVTTRLVYTGPLRAPIAKGAHVAGWKSAIAGRPRRYLPLVAGSRLARPDHSTGSSMAC
jgi:D-alanyl-D-alanine carboxypeptidase (penicillin-binding protein 5/6)